MYINSNTCNYFLHIFLIHKSVIQIIIAINIIFLNKCFRLETEALPEVGNPLAKQYFLFEICYSAQQFAEEQVKEAYGHQEKPEDQLNIKVTNCRLTHPFLHSFQMISLIASSVVQVLERCQKCIRKSILRGMLQILNNLYIPILNRLHINRITTFISHIEFQKVGLYILHQ